METLNHLPAQLKKEEDAHAEVCLVCGPWCVLMSEGRHERGCHVFFVFTVAPFLSTKALYSFWSGSVMLCLPLCARISAGTQL